MTALNTCGSGDPPRKSQFCAIVLWGNGGEAVKQSSSSSAAGRQRPWGTVAAVAILVAAGAAAYSNSFGGPFIFDDLRLIPENPDLRGDVSPWQLVFSPNFQTRPVLGLTVGLNYALGGLDVRGYHVVNLIIHLLAAVVLFGVVRRTLRLVAPRLSLDSNASTGLALAIALVWMLHPLQTQSVTYIIQRCEALMGLFYLLTFYAVIRGAASRRPWAWYGVAILSSLLGMGTKQVMFTAPLAILFYDRAFLAGSFREALRRRWGLYAALVGTWAAIVPYFFTTQVTQKWLAAVATSPAAGAGQASMATPWLYLATQFGVVAHYLQLAVWPDALCLDYDWPPATTASAILPPALLVLGLLALTVWALVRRPAAGFVGVAFFITLAPTSSVAPLEDIAFEHRMYLPLAALAVAAVMAAYIGWTRLAARQSPRVRWAAALIVLGLVAGALGARTYVRNEDYRTGASIWGDTVRKSPANCRAHLNYGVALAAESGPPGRPDASDAVVEQYQEALRLNPEHAVAHYNMAIALGERGRTDEAIFHCREAIRIRPDYAEAHNGLAIALLDRDHADEAARHCSEAIRIKPDYAEPHYNLGRALERKGRPDEAMAEYLEALRINPNYADAHNNLAIILGMRGRTDEAIRHYEEALRVNPDYAEAHTNLAIVLSWRGRMDEAVRHCREAIRANTNYADAYCYLALFLATDPDPKIRNGAEAVRLAEQGCRLTGRKDPLLLDALAAAYAEAGRFPEAVATAREAEALAWSFGKRQMSAQIQARLRLYEAGQPCHVPRKP